MKKVSKKRKVEKVVKNNSPVVRFFDLETMPNLVRTWRKWEQDVIWYERHGYIWSISWSDLNSKKVYHKNITDFPLYKKDKYSDEALVKFIWELVNEADVLVCHNGNAFDIKAITGRFVHYKLTPPRPYKTVDTKLLYRRYLNEDSNSLKDIAEKHGLPLKRETGGYELWKGCENGNKKDIEKMKWYNDGDVVTLKAAYDFILPYVTNHPNMAVLSGDFHGCPNCASSNCQKRGFSVSKGAKSIIKKQRWSCMSCGTWFMGERV